MFPMRAGNAILLYLNNNKHKYLPHKKFFTFLNILAVFEFPDQDWRYILQL